MRTADEFVKIIQRDRPEQWSYPPGKTYAKRTARTFISVELMICYDRVRDYLVSDLETHF
jgi:hypothetical protein